MIITIKSRYLDDEAVVKFGHYDGGQVAIRLYDPVFQEPLSTATVNLLSYGIIPEKGNILVKADREGTGITQGLIEAGVVERVVATHSYGFDSTAHECVLTAKAAEEYKKQVTPKDDKVTAKSLAALFEDM